MHRIDGANVAVTLPTPAAVGSVVGWFKAEGDTPWTQVTGDFLNAVMEEISRAIELAGITLSKTNREQLYAAITAGLVTNAVSLGDGTTLHKVGLLLAESSGAFGDYCLVACSKDTDLNQDHSAAIACEACTDELEGGTSEVPEYALTLASKSVSVGYGFDSPGARKYVVCGGHNGVTLDGPLWRIESLGGVIRATSHLTTGLDYAEYFPALRGPHPPGRILSLAGREARIAGAGDHVLGVVSVAPGVVGGDDGLGWSGRVARDKWGAPLYEEDEDGLQILRKATDYDPGRPFVPRSERPDEWTCVALMGQVRVAVDASVRVGDRIVPGHWGIGRRKRWWHRARGRAIRCMEIERPYDAEDGCAIAWCLVG